MRRTRWFALLLVAIASVAACGGPGASGGSAASVGPPQRGGELTVLEDGAFAGGWPSGLDPATNTTGGANISQMSAVYGGLFLVTANDDGSGAKAEPNQAESYQVLDGGRTVKITIRDGVRFSDGTPMDAEAVAFNFRRDVTSTCTCAPTWRLAQDGISVEGPRTVVLHFIQPNATAINAFPISNVNWIVSPAALQRLGPDQFKINPVGAGPFKVVSDRLSSELVLERNPGYFKAGLPYLDKLTFKSIGGDQPAYQALQAGQAQAYEGLSTVPLLEQAQANSRLTVTVQPPTSPYVVQLNTKTAPFDNELARQAIYYATDFEAISRGLFKGKYPVSQMFTAGGGLFHHAVVPGYRTFDLAKAKQLVQQLGGLTVKLGTLGSYVAQQVVTALQTQWKAAGIDVTIETYQLSSLVQQFNSGSWQAMLQTAGAWDPASGVGVAFRFASTSPFSGVSDPHLDDLLNQASATIDPGQRDALYLQAGQYISDKAYAPFGLGFAPANLAVKGVSGPGLTTKIPPLVVDTGVLWDQVWRGK
ncbi:ABC transporter substrate-binding protein [Amycolatopsis acidiphila]|uniref:ABC transporter substrate-binding protein n=1 Tax=Amycolatopsis acidiphila TaxID=715473 RepID=A0A558A3F3_9PSEU|nr:ABC transporter substrate-binding protein [Amycolatopsis acidiphila]TVT18768.1 ABC transporter substrate-binding protein [Amycolatopsis acidiphila]UIJ56958.1 ABC transporter substrate-binding protein [Amycolatopsis acidiphila]GHG54112.1 ABC transporter substrate-binding protein [Amycolatopsis acidiphila]